MQPLRQERIGVDVVRLFEGNSAAMFYPEARVSGRLRLGLHILWTARQTRSPSEQVARMERSEIRVR